MIWKIFKSLFWAPSLSKTQYLNEEREWMKEYNSLRCLFGDYSGDAVSVILSSHQNRILRNFPNRHDIPAVSQISVCICASTKPSGIGWDYQIFVHVSRNVKLTTSGVAFPWKRKRDIPPVSSRSFSMTHPRNVVFNFPICGKNNSERSRSYALLFLFRKPGKIHYRVLDSWQNIPLL